MSVRIADVDLTPPLWSFRAYQGDPFDFAIALDVDGEPADVDGWQWAAIIRLRGGDVVAWECTGTPNGVELYLRGGDTMRLTSAASRFDVAGRDPLAGEGRTVLRGQIAATARVTPPLRREAVMWLS